jgi:hypothetical protein
MPKRTVTHDTGGTRAGTLACLDSIRKAIDSRGYCTEQEARGMAMSLYPPQVLVRIGAQKIKNRGRGTAARFSVDADAYMGGGAVSPDAVEWFRVVGGNRQLTRLKQHVKHGLEHDLAYDEQAKQFLPIDGCAVRDERIAQVLENAGKDWRIDAVRLIRERLAGREVLAEEFRIVCEAEGVRPHHCNAWGALTAQLLKAGVIEDTGLVGRSRAPKSHARRQPIWRVRAENVAEVPA